MNYANCIKDHYNKNKDFWNTTRVKGFLQPLSLEFYLDVSYQKYRNFCYDMGAEPKTKIQFLRTKVI